MSNKVVSQVYRGIIDDVINNVRQDFEEMGIEKEVLEELQRSWEAKIVATQVAEFEGAPALPPAKSRSSKKQEPKAEVKTEDGNGANGQSSSGNGADQHRSKVARGDGSTDVAGGPDRGANEGADDAAKQEGDDAAAGQKRKRISDDDEIGSDLDDSDDEDIDGGADGDNDDMVLCLYDKVQRVKNKWKCVLKDGVASIDGRDYLFAKCNGEFEW